MTGWLLIAASHAITTAPIFGFFAYILFPRKELR